MKKKLLLFIILIFTITLVSCKDTTILINETKNYEVDVEEKITIATLEDALVNAIAIAEQSSVSVISKNNSLFTEEAHGSGVIIGKNASGKYYVLTNRHVIADDNNKQKDSFYIYLGTKNEKLPAKLEMFHDQYDLALLSFTSTLNLKVATIADSTKLQKGRYVIAVGSPYDYDDLYNTVTVGNISHPNRVIEEEIKKGIMFNANYIQHDASINFGNSGGGLFNINGELIGINTWKITGNSLEIYEGLGFSIPIHIAYQIVQRYIR